jgi:glycosyltransferase involved in cell wall biosynthesis
MILRQLRPDFVHVLNPSAKAFLALSRNGPEDAAPWRIVGDWDEWPARRDLSLPRRIREQFLDRWLRRRADHVIVASRFLQQQFKRDFDIDSAYIPYATYLHETSAAPNPFSAPTAVYMGNLFPAYDHDLIFHAAKMLRDRGQSPAILILGAGPDLARWQSFVAQNQLPNVTLAGYVAPEQAFAYLRHAHVLLFPFRQTLLNLCRCPSKTFAYAQAGRPIITQRTGEVAEVLGENARYIPATAEAFADAIQFVMNAPQAPDIDYHIQAHNWSARTDALMLALGIQSPHNEHKAKADSPKSYDGTM